jgi:hypothetical protein
VVDRLTVYHLRSPATFTGEPKQVPFILVHKQSLSPSTHPKLPVKQLCSPFQMEAVFLHVRIGA